MRDVSVSTHAARRFRHRCSEGAPWPEFCNGELKLWIARMVRDNAQDARFYRTPNQRSRSLVVPLRDEGVLLAVAICAKARWAPAIVSVKTCYGPLEDMPAGSMESFVPNWWRIWAGQLPTSPRPDDPDPEEL